MIAGVYPLTSETFVYRQVHALRRRGWVVHTVSLRPSASPPSRITSVEEPEPIIIYGPRILATLTATAMECLQHPVRSIVTFAQAVADALVPGEPASTATRLKLPWQAVSAIGLAHRLRRLKVEAIHCHFAHAPTTLGMYAARQLGVPFSFTGHANDLFQRRALLKRKLARAAFVGCISLWHRGLYQAIHPRDEAAYPLIRCGVEVQSWQPVQRPDATADKPLRVLTVGRLVEKKGIDTLIMAIGSLHRGQQGRWRLIIAGDGPQRSSLEQLARQAGCDEVIQWEGQVDAARVRELMMHEADIFALPCRPDRHGDRDGIPVVLMEAMACGLPVIAGDLEAIRELVVHGRTGLLVDAATPQPLIEALAQLRESPQERQRLGRAARQWVVQEFSLDDHAARLEEALTAARAKAS